MAFRNPSAADVAEDIVIEISKIRKEREINCKAPLTRKEAAQIVRDIMKEQGITTPAPAKAAEPAKPTWCDRKKVPPTPADVEAYAKSIGYPVDGQQFCDYYEKTGWKIKNQKIKDWQACVRTWKHYGYALEPRTSLVSPRQDYTRI